MNVKKLFLRACAQVRAGALTMPSVWAALRNNDPGRLQQVLTLRFVDGSQAILTTNYRPPMIARVVYTEIPLSSGDLHNLETLIALAYKDRT